MTTQFEAIGNPPSARGSEKSDGLQHAKHPHIPGDGLLLMRENLCEFWPPDRLLLKKSRPKGTAPFSSGCK
jgi:hypothetical protein